MGDKCVFEGAKSRRLTHNVNGRQRVGSASRADNKGPVNGDVMTVSSGAIVDIFDRDETRNGRWPVEVGERRR